MDRRDVLTKGAAVTAVAVSSSIFLGAGCGQKIRLGIMSCGGGDGESVNNIAAAVHPLLKRAVEKNGIPGCVALVNCGGEKMFKRAYGFASVVGQKVSMRDDHRFDLASLTKVVSTTTTILILRERNLIKLDDQVREYLPEFETPGKEKITIRHCLRHTSGLPGFRRYFKEIQGREAYLKAIAAEELIFSPGTGHEYSDLGFIVLGLLVEKVSGQTLDEFVRENIFMPLEMASTGYRPVGQAGMPTEFAATEFCPWREKLMVGEVHDENAYALGGVAGHAGLFSTAEDLCRFGLMLLNKGEYGCRQILHPESVAMLNQSDVQGTEPYQGLGWRMRGPEESSAGFLASWRSFGHTGFTGTSMWLDPDSRTVAVLLSNAIHPDRANKKIGPVRREFHHEIISAQGKSLEPKVKTGLDVLVEDGFKPLRGRRIAVVTNQTALNSKGEHILKLLANFPDINVAVVFGPEHGIRGAVEAGRKVDDSVMGSIPVYSLYGENRRPTKEMGEMFDLVVYDIQDVGARFYTYIWTLFSVMQFCAETGKPVIVLDRPNPIGGVAVEGPMLYERFSSFVGMKPIPIRYGLTIGELAVLFNRQGWLGEGLLTDLQVIKMKGWQRDMMFPDTGLAWVAPSPNMPTWDTALVYPGTCMFEGVNWSEGRGSTIPFEMIGGTGINADRLAAEMNAANLAGCSFLPVTFTPKSIPGVVERPKFQDQQCGGVFVRVDNPREFQPVKVGLALISAVRKNYPDFHEWNPGHFDRLLGTDEVRKQIDLGESPEALNKMLEQGLREYCAIRSKVLLY